jgi:hypothetical protein
MTYAPTVSYLKEQALAAGAGSFWHGKEAQQSINYNAPFPQAHLFLMPAPLNGVNVQYPVRMCWYGKDEHENGDNTDVLLQIQDEQDILTQLFIEALREDGQFDVSEEVQRIPVAREGAQIGTGFFISFVLSARASIC